MTDFDVEVSPPVNIEVSLTIPADGVDGTDGLSAYEIAVENGFVGTEEEWLDSLVGEQGPQGDVGPQGPALDPATLAVDQFDRSDYHHVHLATAKRARGGVIGTNGKAVIALRWDHWLDDLGSIVVPLLTSRGLPSGLAHLTDFSAGGDGGSTTRTWADVVNWNKNGMEVWSHGTNHKDPTPDGYEGLVREIVEAKETIESNNIKCQGWMQPGITGQLVPGVTPYDGMLGEPAHMFTQTGRLLLTQHAHIEGDINGYLRPLPTGVQYGLGHYTIDSVTSLSTLQAIVQEAISYKAGVEFMLHASMLDEPSRITTSVFTQFLDYLVGLWNAGTIEILTPSGIYYADPNSSYRYNAARDGGFEGVTHTPTSTTAGTMGAWDLVGSNYSLGTDGGHSGSNYLVVPNATGVSVVRNVMLTGATQPGQTYMATAWFRAPAGNATGRLIVTDHDAPANFSITKTITLSAGQGWTILRLPFTTPLNTVRPRIHVGRSDGTGLGTGVVHVDDVAVNPI